MGDLWTGFVIWRVLGVVWWTIARSLYWLFVSVPNWVKGGVSRDRRDEVAEEYAHHFRRGR